MGSRIRWKNLGEGEDRDYSADRLASPVMKDPWCHLAANVLVKAVQDCESKDPGVRRDAFDWLNGPIAEMMLDVLEIPSDHVLQALCRRFAPVRRMRPRTRKDMIQ